MQYVNGAKSDAATKLIFFGNNEEQCYLAVRYKYSKYCGRFLLKSDDAMKVVFVVYKVERCCLARGMFPEPT